MKRSALLTFSLGLLVAAAPLLSHAWWNEDWTHRTKVSLNTTSGGIETQEAVGGLVVPVRLHSGNFDFAAAREDGADLRVIAADDKTPLPFSVERFDGINELAVLWVALPSVMPGSDKNLLHVYAGNAEAAAEPGTNVFGPGYLLVSHFAGEGGPAIDVGGALRTQADVPREPNGLIGTAASLTGPAVVWPAAEPLRVPANGALTVALWARSDNPQQGSLLQWGPLRLSLAGGVPTAELGSARLSGGSVPPSTWVHVALSATATQATLYVNGQQAAQAEVAMPEIGGPLSVGADFVGQIDELQVSPSARNAQWLRLAAASQGGDAKLVASTLENAGEAAAGGGGDHGYMGILVKNLTVDAWVVIIILGVMFVIAAWVMVSKGVMLSRTDRANLRFLTRFRGASGDALLQLEQSASHQDSSLFRLYTAGVRELRKRDDALKQATLSGASIDAVKASVDADLVRENHRLNAQMVLLTIAISGGPFLGLLGTVVGVMITFAAIAAAGDVNVNAIAPGIAAALLATVAGLAVAIPALFGYNWLASKIKNISADMQIFVDEFVTLVAERYGQR
jgi:biopolymer transport protein ExbB